MIRRTHLVNFLAGTFAIYSIIVISGLPNFFGYFLAASQHRAISLIFALLLIYLIVSGRGEWDKERLAWHDFLFLIPGLAGSGFVAFFYESHIIPYSSFGFLDLAGVLLATGLGISLLEAIRRLTGLALPLMILALLAIVHWQNSLPGLLRGTGFTIERLTYSIYVGTEGIFGLPLGVATSIIIVFLIFGALLQRAGAGQWFMDMAMAITGWSRGGPAKASVVSSALFGTISGSPSGNTATTGAFTIPLMMRTGYRPKFAAGVEATASTGGMILPPVMGSVAFIMAEFLAIPYAEVVQAALIPAILYFLILFVSVHFQALKSGLSAMPRRELPRIGVAFISGWRYILPIAALIYVLLVMRLSPEVAGLYSLPVLLVSSFFTRDRSLWLTPKNLWEGLIEATRGWLVIGVITAAVGMLLGALTLSGLGTKFSSYIVDVGGGNLILTLVLVGIASLILGIGLDVIPSYLTLVILTAPALVTLGLDPKQAHLFVIYWGLASFLTPPVANTVYVACAISGSGIWETGWEAMRLGAAVFLVSIAFALNPALIMEGSIGEIAFASGTALLATAILAAAFQGYGLWQMSWPQRALFTVAGLLLLAPGVLEAGIAAALVVVTLIWWRLGIWGSTGELSSPAAEPSPQKETTKPEL